MKRRLTTIGLSLEDSKTVILDGTEPCGSYVKYLGYYINHKGVDVGQQIFHNIQKARLKLKELAPLGIFKNALSHGKLLKAFQVFIFSVLEFGISIWQPTRRQSNKVNSFIRNAIRGLTGSSRSTPIKDLERMFSFKNYFKRWCDRHLNWHNHRCFKENDSNVLYNKRVKMSFKPSGFFTAIQESYSSSAVLLQRILPAAPISCINCHEQYQVPNQTIKCQFSRFIGDVATPAHPRSNQAYALELDSFLLDNKSNLLQLHQYDDMIVYSDGSPEDGHQSASYIIIHNNQLIIRGFDISSIIPNSSTRAEIAAITLATLDPMVQNYNGNIKLFTDSQAAQSVIKDYIAGKNYRNVYSIDLLKQSSAKLSDLTIEYTVVTLEMN